MGDFTSCKIKIEKIEGIISFPSIKHKLEKLQEENNINQNIKIFTFADKHYAEIRFGAKWFPSMINEIFSPNEYEIWIIASDEGGASDRFIYYPSNKSTVESVAEKAIFKFDKVILRGDKDKIFENLKEVFGRGIEHVRRRKVNDIVQIDLGGIYTSNNYFQHDYKQGIIHENSGLFPLELGLSTRTELWDSIWNTDGIDIRNCFYKEVLNRPDGKNRFPYLASIQFEYKDKVTNKFVWTTNREVNYWEHQAMNNYFNCANTNYILYNELKKNTEGNKVQNGK